MTLCRVGVVVALVGLAACGGGESFDADAARDVIADVDPSASAGDREDLVASMREACDGDVEGAVDWLLTDDEIPAWALDAFVASCPAAADVLDG